MIQLFIAHQQINGCHNVCNLNSPPVDRVASYSLDIETLFFSRNMKSSHERHILIF